ncbi:MAG TPA: cyanophycin synthetase [Pyrinomonadaceae bacterium]|nr:cyanophycin synthetase [Pyrinomonadaceae bacterium]
MKIKNIRALPGPNIYTYQPAIMMSLDLGTLADRESNEFNELNERLLSLLPGINTHHCSLGRPGGFVIRLQEGTFFGHIVEHVALELLDLAGIGTIHGKTRHDERSIYTVVIEYRAEKATIYLLEKAVELVEAIVQEEPFSLSTVIEEAKHIAATTEVGPTTRSIIEAAERRGIPRWEGTGSVAQLGYGKHLRYIQAAMTDRTSAIAVELAQDKEKTKNRLRENGIPVPEGQVVHSLKEANQAAKNMRTPVVVKPVDGHQGKGVSLEVSTEEEMEVAFEAARKFSSAVLVEEMFSGRNYRVLVIDGRMVAASERFPCHVVGDGVSSIQELISKENRNPLRGDGHEKPLTKIRVDEEVTAHLKHAGMSLDTVPALNEQVVLSNRTNLSIGATARDVTDNVHPQIARMCERASRLIGLDISGVDVVVPDISQPLATGGIIELNASPGLRMHHYPSEGKSRDVGQAVVDALYPTETPSRIPIISITGTNGKTTVTRMVEHILSKTGLCVGMTTTDGIYIGGELVVEGDTTGPRSARVVLSDPAVDVAVLETARGGIMREGLGYDWSDIGVLTNIGDDHIGQDGIKSTDDVLFVKSLVAERVKEGGSLILNADNEHLANLMQSARVKKIPKKAIYFSLSPDNPVLRAHLQNGGTGYFATQTALIEARREAQRTIAELTTLPITMEGAAQFQVANLLAAVAASRAYGIAPEILFRGLVSFSSRANNPGRANLYRLNGGVVMVDYGHNADAFDAICRMTSHWKSRRVTGIITIPGDRDDSVIRRAARVAAKGFHKLIVKEDHELRGRKVGDVANILCEAVREVSPAIECEIVLDEVSALRRAVNEMVQNELIVMFYEKLHPVQEALEELAAEPIMSLPRVETPRFTLVENAGLSRHAAAVSHKA